MTESFDTKKSFLLEPTYKYTTDGQTPHRPTPREALVEWLDVVDFVRKPRRALNAALFVAHWSTFACLVLFFAKYFTLSTCAFWIASVVFLCNGPHTLWYHRYCSHRAFKFKRLSFARLFLWSNPLYTPEEHYAIAHRQHHAFQERVGDPYGPHIGWLGSYVAIDSIQKLNVDIPPDRYEKLQKSVEHIGFKMNSYRQFRRTGTVENLRHYFLRTLVAQALWCSLAYAIGGVPYVVTWYGSTYTLWFLLRDFGWRGHRGKSKVPDWEFDVHSSATNQRFYGYLASEWHDNHHLYPSSANLAFLPSQFDISFQLVRVLNGLGLLESYNDAKPKFLRRFGHQTQRRAVAPSASDR